MEKGDSSEDGISVRQLCRKVMNRNRMKSTRLNDFVTQEDEKQKRIERIKAVKDARNKQHYSKVKAIRLTPGSVNDDAKRFLKGYNERSQLEVCGVCGTDEEPRNLRLCNDGFLSTIQASDLPQYRQYLLGKLNHSWHMKYLECINEEFNECMKNLKPQDTVVKQSSVNVVVEEDDELVGDGNEDGQCI